jgi:hypothetical protein
MVNSLVNALHSPADTGDDLRYLALIFLALYAVPDLE